MILYLAGVPYDSVGYKTSLWRSGATNFLFSYGLVAGGYKHLEFFIKDYNDMILYLAGSLSPKLLEDLADKAKATCFLETYAHKDAQQCARHLSSRYDMQLFIDSGAFTAWAKGTPIVLEDYVKFCRELMETSAAPLTFAALDVIAGQKGSPMPVELGPEFEASSKAGWENYLKMKEDYGIPCIPTFHQGDPWHWLDRMADHTDYIGLSPRKVNKTSQEKMEWLNKVFKRIDQRGQLKTLKTHGLGISSPIFMETYPFYSVDSTAWLQGGRAGAYRWYNGCRTFLTPPIEWKKLTGETIEAVYRYRKQGEADPTGNFGSYWFAAKCMERDVELGRYVNEHWEARGVTWDV